MLFNSVEFIIFFPLVILIYFLIPVKVKQLWLLVASLFFYMCWNVKYVMLLATSILITYFSGLLIEKAGRVDLPAERADRIKKYIVAGSFISNLGILFVFKYFNFAMSCVATALSWLNMDYHVPQVDLLLPVGISFYTFQALSYTMDVYRGDIYAEKNLMKYALFVSFFPQLVAGPIERSKNLLIQLDTPQRFNFEKARDGFLLMLWGYFLKIVLADRIAIFVDAVYTDYTKYNGYYIIVATVLFAFQIYCDFAGYSTIAIGAARILGIEIMDNFNAPYLSTSVAGFWRNWHISLTSWFKDYLYIPLGGSRCGKTRKWVNIMIVFLVSGLWHGADLSYVAWGGLNGLFQLCGEWLRPVREKTVKALKLNTRSMGHKLLRIMCTFALVDFSWLFFRAPGIKEAGRIMRSMFMLNNPWVFFDGSLYECGLSLSDFWLMIVCIGILIFSDICRHRDICIRRIIICQDYWFRSLFIAGSVLIILLLGIWGTGYDANSFIYFQF